MCPPHVRRNQFLIRQVQLCLSNPHTHQSCNLMKIPTQNLEVEANHNADFYLLVVDQQIVFEQMEVDTSTPPGMMHLEWRNSTSDTYHFWNANCCSASTVLHKKSKHLVEVWWFVKPKQPALYMSGRRKKPCRWRHRQTPRPAWILICSQYRRSQGHHPLLPRHGSRHIFRKTPNLPSTELPLGIAE